MSDIDRVARMLDDAACTASPIAQFGDLTEAAGYVIQRAVVAHRTSRGEKRIGVKMGFTSKAKMLQMGVNDVILGRLTDGMAVEDGGSISLRRYIHPRVEPEIAFLLGRRLAGAVTSLQALAAVDGVAPAMEIIDSRYRDFKFSLGDVIADNTSASGFVIGPWLVQGADLSNLGMVMMVDGRPLQIGSSAAILGHPVRTLVSAARRIAEQGECLEAGDIVLAGAATPAEVLRAGTHVRVEVQDLGSAEFEVAS